MVEQVVINHALLGEKAPFCECDSKKKVLYYCSEKKCVNHKQKAYCHSCHQSEKHNHDSLIEITSIIESHDSNWSKLAEQVSSILKDAAQKYNLYLPLIKFFEKEMLYVGYIPASIMFSCK